MITRAVAPISPGTPPAYPAHRFDPAGLPAHPGRVTLVAPDGSETVEPAETLPEWVKFVRQPHGQIVPVVLLQRVPDACGFLVRSYGADGRLLAITTSPTGWPLPPAESCTGWF